MLMSRPPHEPPPVPMVHVVDDDDEYRGSLLYSLDAEGFAARGYSSGEAFLAESLWQRRGVVTLDIDFEPPGSMDGLQIFRQLLARRCPMPVIFLSGPHGNNRELALTQAGLRSLNDVWMYSKQDPLPQLKDKICLFLSREPALRQAAEEERRLLQIVLDVMTQAEREVIGLVLDNTPNKTIALLLSKNEGVVELQRTSGLQKLLGDSRSIMVLGETVGPLLRRHEVKSLVALAEQELDHRLGLLDPLAREVLTAAIAKHSHAKIARAHGWFDEADRERRYLTTVDGHLDRALMLMQADEDQQVSRVSQVRKWMNSLGYFPPCSPSSPSPSPSSP
jgi:FixJ family two-component response regulator